jgi:signal transduction histidine kinase
MDESAHATSPLAIAALELIGDGVSAEALERRFADLGATLRPGVAGALLAELAGLGLARVGRGTATDREYVPTSLGHQLLEGGLTGESAIRLGELERLRTDLLATIAHELRTPLTAVRTSASLLLEPTARPTDDQRRAMLGTIGRNADRMQRLVGDILDLARYRSGAIRLQLRRFDATEMARSAVAVIEPLVQLRKQRLDLDAPDSPGPAVFGDHRRLEQALVNLVSNAQRFAPDGGRIAVAVTADGDNVRWSVTDDGPGIPLEDQPRLFERFFVGGADRQDRREGVGLGLPMALAIAQAHGGSIEVDSRPGRGSTFALVVRSSGPEEAPG